MSITINADDFGISKEVNQAIEECFRLGYIDQTPLMVNMPYADAAMQMAKEQGFADCVGIHLNLTAGYPLTDRIRQNTVFCDERGNFHAGFHHSLKNRLWMSSDQISQISEELEAQIKKYLEYGCTLKHVDSHHHVHTNLPVLKALKPLLKKYDITSIRIGRNLFTKASLLNVVYKKIYHSKLKRTGLQIADYFGSAPDFRSYIQSRGIHADSFCQNYHIEIMTHPMYDGDGILVNTNEPMDASWCRSLCRQEKEN